ncbi:PREDICTED: uncharacterized protein LOC106320108 [Brassica oleracea var. oleracea]|uniref:uncharacterized protein LOC106320108 n=1 Tax=Brassica oleracea var. oleracea TaxID=109376 RepID=UPI0006A6DC5B|nr:PREDICTED: uncharacterized protein LOC106320108 [Brassica oleracea var. oleracea]
MPARWQKKMEERKIWWRRQQRACPSSGVERTVTTASRSKPRKKTRRHVEVFCSLETCLYMSDTSSSKPNRKTSFRDRCLLMAKQQRTRLYILQRCVSMLLCWHDHSISDQLVLWKSLTCLKGAGVCIMTQVSGFVAFHVWISRDYEVLPDFCTFAPSLKSVVQPDSHQTSQTGHLGDTSDRRSVQGAYLDNQKEFVYETNCQRRITHQGVI